MNPNRRCSMITAVLTALVIFLILAIFGKSVQATVPFDPEKGTVILLHGLGRTDKSMSKLEIHLERHGYATDTISYPSRDFEISRLTADYVAPAVRKAAERGGKVHVVTHSMGGILVRQYLASAPAETIDRIVMLAPPNKGSEIIDTFGDNSLFRAILGPAAQQLSTRPDSLPNSLMRVPGEIGIIAGTRSYNPLFSHLIVGKDDGKVSVQATYLPEMQDHLVLPVGHTFIMRNPEAIDQICSFLEYGRFNR